MDLFLAFSLVFLIFVFLSYCVCRALFPVRGTMILVLAQGKGEDLQQKLHALFWLRSLGFLHCPIYIVNKGLDQDGQKLVNHLTARWQEIKICEHWDCPT